MPCYAIWKSLKEAGNVIMDAPPGYKSVWQKSISGLCAVTNLLFFWRLFYPMPGIERFKPFLDGITRDWIFFLVSIECSRLLLQMVFYGVAAQDGSNIFSAADKHTL